MNDEEYSRYICKKFIIRLENPTMSEYEVEKIAKKEVLE